jgi:hypothetical protein
MAYKQMSISQAGVGASDPILIQNVSNADFAALVNSYVTGTVTYDVEYTMDDVVIGSASWVALGDTDRAANSDDAFYFPVRAFRVNVKTGTGTVKLMVMYRG